MEPKIIIGIVLVVLVVGGVILQLRRKVGGNARPPDGACSAAKPSEAGSQRNETADM